MNNIEEAKKFILQKLNECILFTHEDYTHSIYYGYDKQLLRQKKLLRLSDKKEIIFKPDKNFIVLLEYDFKDRYFWLGENFYLILLKKYSIEPQQINNLFKDIWKVNYTWKGVTWGVGVSRKEPSLKGFNINKIYE